MTATYQKPINGWVLPDPWMTHVEPHPSEELNAYYRFVSANVQGYTQDDFSLSRADQVRFLAFMARHGLRASTVGQVIQQLANERPLWGQCRWPFSVLDRFQFDLFRWGFERDKPDLSTLFLNSTAHCQHLYWRNMEPEHFKVKPAPGEQAVYQDAILYGYAAEDKR